MEGPLGSEKRKYSLVLSHSLIPQKRNTLVLIGTDSDLFSDDLGLSPALFVAIFAWLCAWQWAGSPLGWGPRTVNSLKFTNHWPLDNRSIERLTPCYLAAIGSSVRFVFSGDPN